MLILEYPISKSDRGPKTWELIDQHITLEANSICVHLSVNSANQANNQSFHDARNLATTTK